MKDVIKGGSQLLSDEMLKFLDETWFLMPNWKWIALTIAIFVGFMLRPFLRVVLRRLRRFLSPHKTPPSYYQHSLSLDLERPISWAIVCLLWLAALENIGLPGNFDKYMTLIVKVFLTVEIIRILYMAIEALGMMLEGLDASKTHLDSQLSMFATKTLKVLVVILGTLTALQNFGINVVSVLTGLGLGGLAFALAAQDTVANLFGSITILFDKPFKIGDWIVIGPTEGVVEEIGFRSTRIRTFSNSLITMPNSAVSKERVENISSRGKIRVKNVFGLAYDTPPALIPEFCKKITALVQAISKVDKGSIYVYFNNLNKDQLDVLVQFHLIGAVGNDEGEITQAVYCKILEVAKEMKISFGLPTRELYFPETSGLKEQLISDAVKPRAQLPAPPAI